MSRPASPRRTTSAAPEQVLDGPATERFEELREWRRARADGKPAYTICADRALRIIAAELPSDLAGLSRIAGIGPSFLERHADDLLATLATA